MKWKIKVPVKLTVGLTCDRAWVSNEGRIICDDFVYRHISLPPSITEATLHIIKDPDGNIELFTGGLISDVRWRFYGEVTGKSTYMGFDDLVSPFIEGDRVERVSIYMEYEV